MLEKFKLGHYPGSRALREQQVPHRAFSPVRNDKGFLVRPGQPQDQSQRQRATCPPHTIKIDSRSVEESRVLCFVSNLRLERAAVCHHLFA